MIRFGRLRILARVLALGSAVGLSAGPALALSCMRPDPVRSFAEAQASPDRYIVLYGRFDFDPSAMPSLDQPRQEDTVDPVPATFTGMALGPDGFTIPYNTGLWLQPTCAGIWCGRMEPSDHVLAFVRDRGDGSFVLELGPCDTWVHYTPSTEVLDRMRDCLTGEAECTAAR